MPNTHISSPQRAMVESIVTVSAKGIFSVGCSALVGVVGKATLPLIGYESIADEAEKYSVVASAGAIGAALLYIPYYIMNSLEPVVQNNSSENKEVSYNGTLFSTKHIAINIGASFCSGILGAIILQRDPLSMGLCMIAGTVVTTITEMIAFFAIIYAIVSYSNKLGDKFEKDNKESPHIHASFIVLLAIGILITDLKQEVSYIKEQFCDIFAK